MPASGRRATRAAQVASTSWHMQMAASCCRASVGRIYEGDEETGADERVAKRYVGKLVGDRPELCPLDSNLFADFETAMRQNVAHTHRLPHKPFWKKLDHVGCAHRVDPPLTGRDQIGRLLPTITMREAVRVADQFARLHLVLPALFGRSAISAKAGRQHERSRQLMVWKFVDMGSPPEEEWSGPGGVIPEIRKILGWSCDRDCNPIKVVLR